jgi:hypothetical protein
MLDKLNTAGMHFSSAESITTDYVKNVLVADE